MYEKEILLLKKREINLEKGLTDFQIEEVENRYNIIFPKSYKTFLKEVYPVGEGFCKWLDISAENVNRIKKILKFPYESIIENLSEIIWNKKWGKEPKTLEEKKEIINNIMQTSPKIIPVYAHRYMVDDGIDDDPPILSIYYTDIIVYENTLKDYLKREFDKNNISKRIDTHIDFWSDIEEK